MTKTKKAIILAIALTALLTFGWAQRAGCIQETIEPAVATPITTATTTQEEKEPEPFSNASNESMLTPAQVAWKAKMAMCESSNNPNAINEVDLDGTASYGLFQFKPSTLIDISRQYLTIYIDQENVRMALMDEVVQNAAFNAMILHQDEINWESQFPACIRKHGRPPQQ